MAKTLIYNGMNIRLGLSNYRDNNRVALLVYAEYDGVYEDYDVATVNLSDEPVLGNDYNYMDENNMPGITKVLAEAGLAENTGIMGFSGYCQYPLVKLNLDKIQEYVEVANEE